METAGIATGISILQFIDSKWKWIKRFSKRRWYKLFPANFNIVIAIKFEEGLNSGYYYKELRRNLTAMIEQYKLSNIIKLKDFSDILEFKNCEQAETFVGKKNINLLIWGEFSTDTLKKDDSLVNTLNLNFTYLFPKDINNILPGIIKSDIDSKFAFKNYWTIFDRNSFNDLQIISNNLFDITTYIIALTFKIFGVLKESTQLFEQLHDKTKDDGLFKKALQFHLLNNYDLLSIITIYSNINYTGAIPYLEKFLKLQPVNYMALDNLALCKYKTGEVEEAKLLVQKANKLNANYPLTILNMAYFKIREKDYKHAFELYEKISRFNVNEIHFEPLEVIEFLNKEYDNLKDSALIYASAMMNYHFGDNKMAKKDLNKFLRLADKKSMKEMYRKSQSLLDKKKI